MRRAVAAALAAALLLTAADHQGTASTLSSLGSLLPPFLATNFEDLVKAAVATCEALPLGLLFSRPFTLETPHLDLVEYRRGSKRVYKVAQAHERLREQRPMRTLALYIPGWWNTPTDDSAQALANNLLHRIPVFLVLDTRLSFSRGYVSSASRVKALAHLLYKFVKRLHQQGIAPPEAVHLIGFSLGAHVAGMTGSLVQKNLKRKLGRVTALDPAKPCFSRDSEYRLGKKDATFVEVFHSSGVLGLDEPMGHADVFVNGVNIKQPECRHERISLECDHGLAWKVYSESINEYMMANRCNSWNELEQGSCTGNMTAIGYESDIDTRGLFLYTTKSRSRRTDPELKVFSPFDLFTWWLRD